jgi:hypothetical protein
MVLKKARIYVMMPYTLASSIKTVVLVWLDTPLFFAKHIAPCPWVSHQRLLLLALAKVHKNAFYSVFFSLAFKLLVNNSQVNLNLAKVEE